MPKLHQILAIESGEKARSNREIADQNKAAQKAALFEGHVKNYLPKDDEGEQLPTDVRRVQLSCGEVLENYQRLMTSLWDINASKEYGNYNAPGVDVVVGDTVLVKNAPIPFLLYLGKQLDDVETAVRALPTLDPSVNWQFNEEQSIWQGDSETTNRSQKVRRNHVVSPATDKHQAQVEVFTEDVPVGTWTSIRHSGAMPVPEKKSLLSRISEVKKAVVFAREQANEFDVTNQNVAAPIFNYLLG